MKRIAFDLDETLGVPVIAGDGVAGFQARPGCLDLLGGLRGRCTLLLWSVSSRRYAVVPVYGGPEDAADPLARVRLVEWAAGLGSVRRDDG
jgi:hypothetical protein